VEVGFSRSSHATDFSDRLLGGGYLWLGEKRSRRNYDHKKLTLRKRIMDISHLSLP
jgi:hypothetical protein